jgi:hypothetical protein
MATFSTGTLGRSSGVEWSGFLAPPIAYILVPSAVAVSAPRAVGRSGPFAQLCAALSKIHTRICSAPRLASPLGAGNRKSADRIELAASRRIRDADPLRKVLQPGPFARHRIEAPQHPLGLPPGKHAHASKYVELSACRSPVDFLFACGIGLTEVHLPCASAGPATRIPTITARQKRKRAERMRFSPTSDAQCSRSGELHIKVRRPFRPRHASQNGNAPVTRHSKPLRETINTIGRGVPSANKP